MDVGSPAEALADAHVAGPLAAPLAVGERVEVGFLGGLARADMAAAHEARGGGGSWWSSLGVWVCLRGALGLRMGMLALVVVRLVFLGRRPGRRSLHRFVVRLGVDIDRGSLPLAGGQGDDLAGGEGRQVVGMEVAAIEGPGREKDSRRAMGTAGAGNGIISACGRKCRQKARIRRHLVGAVVSPPLLGRRQRRRFLGYRRHGVPMGGF